MKNLKKNALRVVGVAGASSASLLANAQATGVDTTAAVAEVTAAGTGIAAVGGAILVLGGISLAYRWVKATFF